MLLIVFLILFSMVNLFIAQKRSMKLVEVQPVTFSVFILVLYFLGFINRIWLVDYIICSLLLAFLCYIAILIFKDKGSIKEYLPFEKILEPSFLVFTLVTVLGMVLLSQRGIWAHDEISFWGPDIRAIFYLQGYAEKNMQCVEAFGDYPPGYQLVAAWAMHLLGRYHEGIQMSAFFMFMMIYTAPVIANISKNIIQVVGAILILPILYAFGPDILYARSPDVLMGATYGCALVFIYRFFDQKNNELAIALILSVTVIVKSIGVEWGIFAIAFYIGIHIIRNKRIDLKAVRSFGITVFVYLSWFFFCNINQRRSYSTNWVLYKTNETASSLRAQYGIPLFNTFIKSLFSEEQSSLLGKWGISAMGIIVITVVILVFMHKKMMIQNARFLLLFVIVTGFIEYAILLYSVENMFLLEYSNYMDLEHMIMLVRRYAAPYTIGNVMLIVSLFIQGIELQSDGDGNSIRQGNGLSAWVIILVFYLMVTPWKEVYTWFWDYRNVEQMVTCDPEDKNVGIKQIVPIVTQMDKVEKLLVVSDSNTMEAIDSMRATYYAAPVPILIMQVEEDMPVKIEDMIESVGSTAIAFLSKNQAWEMLDVYLLDDGSKLNLNTVYTINLDESNSLHFVKKS